MPPPEQSGIDHVVVLMMENRSFDHMLGWLPGANGVQAGRSFADTSGQSHNSFPLTLFQNCASLDPDPTQFRRRPHCSCSGGAMNGFLLTDEPGDQFPIGYYGESDLPFFASAAQNWTICDNYHCSMLGPTWPNRLYMHCGQTDRLTTGGFQRFLRHEQLPLDPADDLGPGGECRRERRPLLLPRRRLDSTLGQQIQ